jgi:hypothetical protein
MSPKFPAPRHNVTRHSSPFSSFLSTAREREGERERGSEGARERGSEGARERGREGARERGRRGARTCGNRKGNFAVAVGEHLEVGVEIVRDLEHDAREVDRVDRSQRICLLEFQVPEKRLYYVLAVIKGALDSDAMNVFIEHARHLKLLDWRDATLREEDEALHSFLAA